MIMLLRLRSWRRWNWRNPELWILALNVVHKQCASEDKGGGEQHDRQEVPPQCADGGIHRRQKCSSSSRRVSGLGQVHDDEGNGTCKRGSEPLQTGDMTTFFIEVNVEDDGDDDTNEGAEKMAEDESPWLGERDIDGSIAEDRRCALCNPCQCCGWLGQGLSTYIRSDDGRHVTAGEVMRVPEDSEQDTKPPKGTDEAPHADEQRR